jgi:Tfp pilus assembly major pilin PilA
MIVVAIIAILAAIAIPAYNNYIREARMAKVTDHYDEAIRATKAELAKRAAVLARGGTLNQLDVAGMIDIINPEARQAPQGGGDAFSDTADDANGVVQVTMGNTTIGFESVTVTRPDYLDLGAAESVTVDSTKL